MTDFASLLAADRGKKAHVVHLVDQTSFEDWARSRPAEDRALLKAQRFDGKTAFDFAILPRGTDDFEVVSAVADANSLGPWCLATLGEALPEGTYRLTDRDPGQAPLGWLLAQHRFDPYRKAAEEERGQRILLTGEPAKLDRVVRLAEAVALVRDLVNTPAGDLGPAELEKAVRTAAERIGATVRVTSGDELETGYPLISAVRGAATRDRAPRLIELEWGDPKDPRIAIIGKGVCFDSGGLDLKPGSGMRLMKKDMGGAAHALALAMLIAGERLRVHLHLLIPAVENAVSGAAYRPGDVVKSRNGLQVEIDNTDAEGRLILADAITKAAEAEPELMIDFATLTGAARIALGPDLPALSASDDAVASDILDAGAAVADPAWRMPLWDAYDEMLKSDIADLANASNTPMAGAVVAAMFLKRFVPKDLAWAHFDTYAWRDTARPGRPKGGEALGLRAVFEALARRYGQA